MKIRLSEHFTYKRLLRFVFPSIIMMIFTSIYGVVDGLFVSNFVGGKEFAALNLIMPFIMIIGGMGFIKLLTNFFTEGMSLAFNSVPKNDAFVLPADYYKYTTPFEGEMKDSFKNAPTVKEVMKNPGKVPYIDKAQKIKYDTAPKAPMPKGNFVEINKMLGR